MRSFMLPNLLLVLAGAIGCGAPTTKLKYYHRQYDAHCEMMGENYRLGQYKRICFNDMTDYFERRLGKMTSEDLKRLLGPPRVVAPEDGYYSYALVRVYGVEPFGNANECGTAKHDQVLHYGQDGPPEHWIGDESSNLFFVVKNDVVISMRGLFP